MDEGVTQSMGGGGAEPTRSTAPAPGVPREFPATPVPARIGRYTIVGVLGEGGMGTVYEAQQESPKRAVALKVIRAGYLSPQLLKRFEHESQVLGRLQHSGIAQVYEAGTVQDERGQPVPFFAMEFIRGVPLTEYASQRNLGTRERLDLVARICDAVYHAHQKGVIHRDLKPGNILVDESGQPKIFDFGIARATDSDIQQTTLQTDIGQLIGTVPYMSPEQVGGDPDDLDTRSDVYALGVIAYELLAGRLPYDLQRKAIHEAARIIKEDEPTRLSSINRNLRGDVETIVAKALEKDKLRRYQSAESLASDIRRYLKDEPIAARRASTWYQVQKFSRRNRGLVGGVAASFVLLLAGLIGTGYGLKDAVAARDEEAIARKDADDQRDAAVKAREAEAEQRKQAQSQRDKAERIAEFMSDTLKGAGPSVALGRDITMLREMVDSASSRIDNGDLAGAPEAELRLRITIGSVLRDLGDLAASQRVLEPALALSEALHAGDHEDRACVISEFGLLYYAKGDFTRAEGHFRDVLAMRRRLGGNVPALAADVNNLASTLQGLGKLEGAEALYEEALELRRSHLPADHSETAVTVQNLATVARSKGDPTKAEQLYRQSLEMYERLGRTDDPQVANVISSLGSLLEERGALADAEPLLRRALAIRERLYPHDHPEIAHSLNNLAMLVRAQGRPSEAAPLFHRALDMLAAKHPGAHPQVASALNNLAAVLQDLHEMDLAESYLRRALEMRRSIHVQDHSDIAESLNNLGFLLAQRSERAEAESLFREALAMARRLFPGDHAVVVAAMGNLADILQSRRDVGTATMRTECYEMSLRLFGDRSAQFGVNAYKLAAVLKEQGELRRAAECFQQSINAFTHSVGPDHFYTGAAGLGLGRTLEGLGRLPEAESALVEALRVLSNAPGVPLALQQKALEALVSVCERQHESDPSKGFDTKAAAWKVKLDAITPPEPAPTAPAGGG